MPDSPVRGPGVVGPGTVQASGGHAAMLAAKQAKGLSFDELASAVGIDAMLLAAALTGEMPLLAEEAEALAQVLGVEEALAREFEEIPARGTRAVLDDPTIYRLQEIVLV